MAEVVAMVSMRTTATSDRLRRLLRTLVLAASIAVRGLVRVNAADSLSFSKDVAPIFVRKCVVCHGPEKAKGKYRLDTFSLMMVPGGDKKAPVVPGKPEESRIIQLITAKDPDDRMPQKDDPLPQDHVDLLKRWISAGARFDGADTNASIAAITPRAPYPAAPERYVRPYPVQSLVLSKDAGQVYVGGYREVLVWDAKDGRLARRISGFPERILGLALSPNDDGKWLAAGGGKPGESGDVLLLDLTTTNRPSSLAYFPDAALCVAFSPDGKRLACGGSDNSIRIFDLSNPVAPRQLQKIEQHADWVMSVQFSPDGKQLVSASRDRSARIYAVESGELVGSYQGHDMAVLAAAFGPDGKRACSAGKDKKIHVWDVADGKKLGEIDGFDGEIIRLIVDGENIYNSCADHKVRVHAWKDRSLVRTFDGQKDWVYALSVRTEAGRIASGGYDGVVQINDLKTGDLVTEFSASPGVRMDLRALTK